MELNDTIVRNENTSLDSEIDDSQEREDHIKENHHERKLQSVGDEELIKDI